MNYKTTQEMAKIWKVNPIEITYLLRHDRIPGAKKEGKQWLIPEDTVKPIDGRRRGDDLERLPLPIGIDKFKEIVNSHYYVDKTLMIKEIIDDNYKVYLFTRPRRFGKSLNMDMIKTFFEKSEDHPEQYFKYTNIWYEGHKYQSYMGQYPVINVTFKDVRGLTWEETFNNFKEVIANEFRRHKYLLESQLLDCDKEKVYNFIAQKAQDDEYSSALEYLSILLEEYHHQAPIIIMDEYDTPITSGYMNDYYDQVINFMRMVCSKTFKGNEHLSYGFLTGINRIAKESIFSGLNNIKEYSILSTRYNTYFGFTHEEVQEMFKYYHIKNYYDEACEWYDGYNFGGQSIYNPWSIINYVSEKGIADAYWVNTSSNDIIKNIIKEANSEIRTKLVALLEGRSVTITTDLSLVYPRLKESPEAIFTLLLNAGYLKAIKVDTVDRSYCQVMIPNKEVRCVYHKEILEAFPINNISNIAYNIRQAMLLNNMPSLEQYLKEYLINAVSYFDTHHKDFYQGLLLGLYACLTDDYYILSNREAGNGRYDISLEPRYPKDYDSRFGIIIELKVLSKLITKDSQKELKELSLKALKQINEEHYDDNMKNKGITVLKLGMAFYKKDVEIVEEVSR